MNLHFVFRWREFRKRPQPTQAVNPTCVFVYFCIFVFCILYLCICGFMYFVFVYFVFVYFAFCWCKLSRALESSLDLQPNRIPTFSNKMRQKSLNSFALGCLCFTVRFEPEMPIWEFAIFRDSDCFEQLDRNSSISWWPCQRASNLSSEAQNCWNIVAKQILTTYSPSTCSHTKPTFVYIWHEALKISSDKAPCLTDLELVDFPRSENVNQLTENWKVGRQKRKVRFLNPSPLPGPGTLWIKHWW